MSVVCSASTKDVLQGINFEVLNRNSLSENSPSTDDISQIITPSLIPMPSVYVKE